MLEFHKFHGLGNDFIVCEGEAGAVGSEVIEALCRRHRGVGADGVLLVTRVEGPSIPTVSMVVYNRDGSRPEMCGNGVRCVAAYARSRWGLDETLIVDTDAGPRRCHIEQTGAFNWQVEVDMGPAETKMDTAPISIDNRQLSYIGVDVGNPHAVIFELPDKPFIDRIGELVNADHRDFVDGVNVEFVAPSQAGKNRYRTTVYERGVGRTKACGTGACAVAAAVWETERVDAEEPVQVELPGGVLTIERRDQKLWMTGDAEYLFAGRWRPASTPDSMAPTMTNCKDNGFEDGIDA